MLLLYFKIYIYNRIGRWRVLSSVKSKYAALWVNKVYGAKCLPAKYCFSELVLLNPTVLKQYMFLPWC